MIRKSRVVGTNKQVSQSSICKYNLLRKADTLFESLYRPGKISRLFRCKNWGAENVYHTEKKTNVCHKLERKGQSMILLLTLKGPSSEFQEKPQTFTELLPCA